MPAPRIIEETGSSPLEARIETYTVEFDRSNKPSRGHVVGRLKRDDGRFLANHADEKTLKGLASWEQEPIGRSGWVWTVEESGPRGEVKRRNVFSFQRPDGSNRQEGGGSRL